MSDADTNRAALLILAHALRLNTTCAQPDQGFEPWPLCPHSVLDRCREMLERLPRTKATCAAIALLDLRTEEEYLFEQPEMLTRMHFLAHPKTSGSPA